MLYFISARAAMLTGRLPIRNGFYSNNVFGRNGNDSSGQPHWSTRDSLSLREIVFFDILLNRSNFRSKIFKAENGAGARSVDLPCSVGLNCL